MDDPYQDTVSAPLDREFDNDAVGQEDEDDILQMFRSLRL